MIENDTWYRCTICGREGRVGRCCGDETREPLNELAIKEQAEIKESQKTIVQQLKAEILPLVGRGIVATDAKCIGTANYLFREIQAKLSAI